MSDARTPVEFAVRGGAEGAEREGQPHCDLRQEEASGKAWSSNLFSRVQFLLGCL